MDFCLPRTNSITDKAILVKTEAAKVTDTTTKPEDKPVTDGTTKPEEKPTTDGPTKPAEKPVIAIVTAGEDNRIVPRGLESTS